METLIQGLAVMPLIVAISIFIGLIYKGIDRRLAARMQARVGPPIRQPFWDLKKLMMKESIVPKNAVGWIFSLMPVVALLSSIMLLMYVPFMWLNPVLNAEGDLIVVLYLLIIPSLALVVGGFASGSPYATVGAQREMVTMISYEFPLAVTIVALAWLTSMSGATVGASPFLMSSIMDAGLWGLAGPAGMAGIALLFIVMIFVTTGELGAIPFDSAEAETEICGGLLVEYSGRNLGLFYIASAVKMVAIGSLLVGLFMPQALMPASASQGATAFILSVMLNAAFFLLKLFIVIFLSSTFIRVAVARFRITQVVKVYWGYTTMVALLGLLLIGVDIFLKVM